MGLRWLILLGFGLVVVGAFLTWSDNPPFSENGIERTTGVFGLVVAAGAGVITAVDRRPRGAIIALSSASLVSIATVVELIDLSSGSGAPGTGLYLAVAGALIATVSAGLLTFSLFKKPESTGQAAVGPDGRLTP